MFGAHYLDNGWRYEFGANGAPVGMATWKSNGHMTDTLKGQGRDPNMFRAQYLDNGWRYRLGSNGPPIGNGPLTEIRMVT